jgi:hypothetical protein
MLEAISGAVRSRADFVAFEECLREEDNDQVVEWEAGVAAWMSDKSLPDPYRIPASSKYLLLYNSMSRWPNDWIH